MTTSVTGKQGTELLQTVIKNKEQSSRVYDVIYENFNIMRDSVIYYQFITCLETDEI